MAASLQLRFDRTEFAKMGGKLHRIAAVYIIDGVDTSNKFPPFDFAQEGICEDSRQSCTILVQCKCLKTRQ